MRAWLLLLALTAAAEPHRVTLVQELVRLDAMERKTVVLFPLEQQGGQIEVKFASKRGGEGVRVAVYERGAREPLASTKYELDGELRTPLARQHEYRVEVENLRQRLGHALVDLEVTLVFGGRIEPAPPDAARHLDPARRRYTIAPSLGLFGLILAYSAIKLTPPVLERLRGQR